MLARPAQSQVDRPAADRVALDVAVFAAATGSEEALERPDWQNGTFTKALVEALGDEVAYDHTQDYEQDGVVDFNMLASYTYDRVKFLTGDRQHPAGVKPTTMLDFPIASRRRPS